MIFDNHPPIDLRAANKIASASADGGVYDGIGYDTYSVVQGRRIHLYHSEPSGCEYNNQAYRSRMWLGAWATTEDLINWLVAQPTTWWTNALLKGLGHEGPIG